MKFVFLAGGSAGFALGAGTAFWAGREPDRILLDGAVGCLVGALLFRWFWTVLVHGIRETIVTRHAAAVAAAEAAAPAKSK
ncbi:MAG TPA: hypothetical protein VGD88_08640 [Opitutaceae bacterium]